MKNLKKIFITSVMSASAIAGGVTAFGQEIASPGGYGFSHKLTPASAAFYLPHYGVKVYNELPEDNNLVSYWHAWFYDNDLSNKTNTTYITKQNTDFVTYSIHGNSGYVAVIEIQTTNYFYYLEVNHMTDTVVITYSHVGDYPLFYDAIWTAEKSISNSSSFHANYDQLHILKNPLENKLMLSWMSDNITDSFIWALPY